MNSLFRKKIEAFPYYDSNGKEMIRQTEVRMDPLTGETSRIVFDPQTPLTPADYNQDAADTAGTCPFCPENVHTATPQFAKEVVPEGRLTCGEAIVFPNLFPYSKHNGVVVFSGTHYVRLNEFTVPLLLNAFQSAQMYAARVMQIESAPVFASINWNYLPIAGGSIIHPHLHVIVSESKTNYRLRFDHSRRHFLNETDREYLDVLYETEKNNGQRWIGENGKVAWLHAFAPKSHNDFIAIFRGRSSITDITRNDWLDFSKGLQSIFATLSEQGFASFNLMLAESDDDSPLHVRLIPRLALGGLSTSDMNVIQMLHQEPLSYKVPEDVTAIARRHFQKQ